MIEELEKEEQRRWEEQWADRELDESVETSLYFLEPRALFEGAKVHQRFPSRFAGICRGLDYCLPCLEQQLPFPLPELKSARYPSGCSPGSHSPNSSERSLQTVEGMMPSFISLRPGRWRGSAVSPASSPACRSRHTKSPSRSTRRVQLARKYPKIHSMLGTPVNIMPR